MKFRKDVKCSPNVSGVAGITIGKREKEALAKYKQLASLTEDTKTTDCKINDFVLSKICNIYSIPKYDMKKIIMQECDAVEGERCITEDADPKPSAQEKKAARELEAEVVEAEDKSELEKMLDHCLKRARVNQKRDPDSITDYPNLLIIGSSGFAKSSVVKSWSKANGINLYTLVLSQAGPEKIGGIIGYDPENSNYSKELANKQLVDALSKPNTVLFLDEYNRAKSSVRATLLKLVQDHTLTIGSEEKYFPNFLFTVAAINPVSSSYETHTLDTAELSRFKKYNVAPNPLEQLRFLNKKFDKDIEDAKKAGDEEREKEAAGRKAIANELLKSPKFKYSSLQDEEENVENAQAGLWNPTNYRNLTLALEDSDGTKDSFLQSWKEFCDPSQYKTIEDILKNYRDIDDKANDALKRGTTSKIFQGNSSIFDKLKKALEEED